MIRDWLQNVLAAGPLNLGEISARRIADNLFTLRHWQDAKPKASAPLRRYSGVTAARELARFDQKGCYRPLKGAPTLPSGWELQLDSIDALKLAIDAFYPGALASWIAWREGRITPADLRDTLMRQSGMYRVTQKLTFDQANELAGRFCRSDHACLRTILWTIDGKRPDGNLPETKFDLRHDQLERGRFALPFLCVEACNLFVAEARKTVKQGSS